MEEQIRLFLSTNSGSGDGDGYGSGDGDGSGSGSGDGSGSGYGYGSGSGDGYSDGSGVKMFNGDTVYMIDGIPTIIKHIHGNIAQGYILQPELTLAPTYIVKENNKFAHGVTLHEAHTSLQEKMYDDSTEEERINAFIEHFTEYSAKYSAKELFVWHHVLTGSCKQGRLAFCHDRGINLDKDYFTVYEFINLTRSSYGAEVIEKLEETINKQQ